MKKLSYYLVFFGIVILSIQSIVVYGQSELTVAISKPVSDAEAIIGDIVSVNDNGELVRTTASFDQKMYGVISDTAVIVYHPTGEGTPVVTTGEAEVNVTTFAGPIQVGDIITSSTIPGKGQKATNTNGWVLGVALSNFAEGEGEQITLEGRTVSSGQVSVAVKIGPGNELTAGVLTQVIDQLGYLVFKNVETPERADTFFRYVIAGLIAIAAIAIGFGSFGKNITRGIEAIGRNPLAKRQIQTMIILNIFLIAVICLAGITLSLAIIRF